jgi:hypothetical protein
MKTQTIDLHVLATGFSSGTNSNASGYIPSRSACPTAVAFACMLLVFSLCFHKNAAAQQSPLSSSPAAGQKVMNAEIPVLLAKSVDSKKLKAGEEVDGKTAANLHLKDGTAISRGAKVVGHVTEAKARSNGDAQSSLGIVFDKIDLADGKDLAMTAVIQAVAPSLNPVANTGGGIGYGGMNEIIEKPPTPQFTQPSIPLLNDQSVGVLGIKNLQLGTDGVLTSDQKAVKLDGGTHIMVQAQITGS